MRRTTKLLLEACVVTVVGGPLVLSLQACAGTYAGEGAKAGLVGGAVAGAVGSLFWGGNVVSNMAVGAVKSRPRSNRRPPRI
jgi:hypothetical protein